MPVLRTVFLIVLGSSLLWLTAACRISPPSQSEGQVLDVYAAASLTDAFTELGQNFEAVEPRVQVRFNFAGSQALAQQLSQGSPADVFASANETQMGVAVEAGRVNETDTRIFAHNELVLVYPQDNPGQLTALEDLRRPGVRLILAAEAVPVGRYSQQFLSRADAVFGNDYLAAVQANVVSYEQNVRAVLTKISLGEGDAGIVYRTDAATVETIGRIDIPPALNVRASYLIAPVTDTARPDLTTAFMAYVLSPPGQAVLQRYGFVSPGVAGR